MSDLFSFDYFGSTIQAKSLGVDTVPPTNVVLTSHCIPFTADGKVVAVDIIGRGVDIPGGHIDEGETAVEAMQREVKEEAQIAITHPVLIDTWKLSSTDNALGITQKPYLLLYAADVESMDDFVSNNETSARLVLDPEEFIAQYFGDKQQARILITTALAARRL